MMMDNSILSHERQIECFSMERSKNELTLTYLRRSQSTLMRKCVAEQTLGNRLEIFSIYLEIYSLDVEVTVGAEINELKLFRNVTFKGSKEKQLIELNECLTVTMKFGIIGKTMTSIEKTVFWKSFVVLCESVENNLIVSEMESGKILQQKKNTANI